MPTTGFEGLPDHVTDRIKELEQQVAGRDAVINGKVKQLEHKSKRIQELEAELEQSVSRESYNALHDAMDKIQMQLISCKAERDRLREALPDADKLIMLAAWLDIKHPEYDSKEVQDDLRRWGYGIKALEGL